MRNEKHTDHKDLRENSTEDVPAAGATAEIAPEDDTEGSGEEKVNVKKEAFSWIRMIVIVVVVVIVLTKVVFINARIPSASMENTIMTKDRLIGFRFSYWFGEPERGDIILFSYPVDESQTFIKRVIGLPGETVRIENGKIYIDDSEEPLTEDYLAEEWVIGNDGYEFTVPEDCYFVMGDNRNNSDDGRYWADNALAAGLATTQEEAESYSFVSKDKIKGKAVFIYYKGARLLTAPDYGDLQ